MSDDDDSSSSSSEGHFPNAFERMRQGADDQNYLHRPWGRGKQKKGPLTYMAPPCRNARLVAQQPPPSSQTRLFEHNIRPERWSAEPFNLDEDILQLVAEALMVYIGGDRDLRALAVTSRVCAKGVRAALDMARKKLNALRLDYLQAKAKHYQIYSLPRSHGPEGLEADLELQEAKSNFSNFMYRRTGIPHGRISSILFNAERLSFHDNRSLLGHIADGCELCGAREAGRPYRGANIALHACPACRDRDRVRLDVQWPPDEHGRVKITIPKAPTVGNTLASALLSRRTAHKRRMAAKRASANRPIKLSKRVHYFECTPVLECLVMTWIRAYCADGAAVGEAYVNAHIELWHVLPPGFESYTFASVLELCEHEEDRARAARHEVQCKARRHELSRMVRDYRKLVQEHEPLICMVNDALRDPNLSDWGSWHLAMDLCCASRAFELRWVFAPRVSFSPGRDWLGHWHDVLKLDEGDVRRMMLRIQNVLYALRMCKVLYSEERSVVRREHGADVSLESFHASWARGRKCYLEVIKRMPTHWLEAGDVALCHALRNLRRAPMHFALEEPAPPVTHQLLTITVHVEPAIFGVRTLTLTCSVGKYSVAQIGKLVCMPEIEKLTPPIVAKLSRMANMAPWAVCPLPDNPLRDQARTILYGLPGAHLSHPSHLTIRKPTE